MLNVGRLSLVVCTVMFALPSALNAQEWVTKTVPGAKNPAEISTVGRDPGDELGRFFAEIFTISQDDQSNGNVLEYTRYNVDDPSASVSYRLPTETGVLFGMSHQVVSYEGARYVAYIDDGKVMAQRSTDGGETWTRSTVAGSDIYGEVQLSPTTIGVLLAAYNYRLRQIEIYRFIAATLVWQNMGSLLRGKVVGVLNEAPRMTMDGDERKDDIVLGWAELFPGGCTYWVGRFSLPSLTPVGSPVRIPVVYSTAGIKELRMTRAGDYVAGLSAVGDRYKLFSFPYKQSLPTVSVEDLGPVRISTTTLIGGIGLTGGGTNSVYTATATSAGDVDVRQYLWGSDGMQMRSLPPIRNAHSAGNNLLPYDLGVGGRGAEMRMRLYFPGSLRVAEFTGCVDSRRRLCMNSHRFDISVSWRDSQGNTGSGRAVPLTTDTGYFWFFDDTNIEMVIKVLNACANNGRYWVFAGGLTNVEVDITVRDSQTGALKTYHNPLGTAFQPILDTSAFEGCTSGNSLPTFRSSAEEAPIEVQGACISSDTALCVSGGRFRVEANWRTNDSAGTGKAVKLTEDSGYFWFFDRNNVELITKVLNACVDPFNHHWVFAAGLTNVEVELVVTDTLTGAVKRYENPRGTAYQPIQDTSAFASCP